MIIALGFVITLFIPALPLRTRAKHGAIEEAEEALAGPALPTEAASPTYPGAGEPPRRELPRV